MNIFERLVFWRKLAQANPTIVQPTAPLGPAPQVSLSQIPNYRPQLFSIRPNFTEDLQSVFDIFNSYLFKLSNGKLSVVETWRAPSVGPSEFTNSVKNIYTLAKWFYSVVSANQPPYNINGLKKIVQDLKNTIINMDFPDPAASPFKAEIVNISQVMLNKLGT